MNRYYNSAHYHSRQIGPNTHTTDGRKLDHALSQPQACILCGTYPYAYKGLFVPDKPLLWGGEAGKDRVIVYALYQPCFQLPDRMLRIEARIQADLAGHRN